MTEAPFDKAVENLDMLRSAGAHDWPKASVLALATAAYFRKSAMELWGELDLAKQRAGFLQRMAISAGKKQADMTVRNMAGWQQLFLEIAAVKSQTEGCALQADKVPAFLTYATATEAYIRQA